MTVDGVMLNILGENGIQKPRSMDELRPFAAATARGALAKAGSHHLPEECGGRRAEIEK